jgi:hypothetical protein
MYNYEKEITDLRNEISMLEVKCQRLIVENKMYKEAFEQVERIVKKNNQEIEEHIYYIPKYCK